MEKKQGILVLDDETSICESITLAFQEDYDVITSTKTQEALSKLTANPHIALVFLDLKLVDEDGIDALREIRAKRPDIKVLVLTGKFTDEAEKQAVEALGVTDYIMKPFDLFQLTDEVKSLLK